jgi:hypothetical protein
VRYDPDPAAHDVYNRLFQLYLKLYPPLAPLFKEVVDLDLPRGWIR